MSSLIYTDHAVQRMEQRKITHDLILDVLSSPDGRIKQTMDKEIIYKKIKNRSDNLIAVVIVGKKEILTVMNFFEIKA